MKKLEIMLALLATTLVITLLNSFLIFGLGQQVASLKSPVGLVGASPGSGQLEEINPLGQETGTGSPAKLSADDDPFLGPENAKVTVIEFSDFECPYCAAAMGMHDALISQFKSRDPSWEAAVPKLKELAEQGKIKLVYRDFPLNNHQNAQKAAEASECADEQGKFWEMHDKLFENSESLSVPAIKQFAKDIGLNASQFDACLDSGKMASEVQKDLADGQNLGVSGTPAFFVNGQLVSGAQPFSVFEQIIESELAKGGA